MGTLVRVGQQHPALDFDGMVGAVWCGRVVCVRRVEWGCVVVVARLVRGGWGVELVVVEPGSPVRL